MTDLTPAENQPMESAPESNDAPAYPEGNIFGRFVDLFVSPARLMDKVGSRPALWLVWLVIFVVTAGFTWLVAPISGPEQVEMMQDSPFIQNAPAGVMEEQYEQALNPTTGQLVRQSLIGGLVGIWNAFLLGTLFWGFTKLSGGKGRYIQALGITSWSGLMPMVVGPAIALPIVLSTETLMGTSLGLATLVPDGDPSNKLYMILKFYTDFPTWWGLVLAVIGFERVFGLSRSSAALTVILVWAVAMLVPLVPTLVFM